MKNFLLSSFLLSVIIVALLFSMPLMAQDSGLYFNPERDGEGISLTRNGDTIQFMFWNYEPNENCYNIEIPNGGLVNEENCHEQRYFMSSGDPLTGDNFVDGWLYNTVGLNYPQGITDPVNPFVMHVGEPHIVGLYTLERQNNGWRLVVIQFGDVLNEDDPLYDSVYEFSTLLFPATD